MDKSSNCRLGHRFHQTFIPERHYISSLLKFANNDGVGNDFHVSDKTGIPTGKSSGKVPAIIKYCKGMDLLEIDGKGKTRKLLLTHFGKTVQEHDPNISKPITQWIAHLNLCRKNGGAETWFLCFGSGTDVLGYEFTRDELEDFLSRTLGRAKRSLIGPMIRAYEDSGALKMAAPITSENNNIKRFSAPLTKEFQYGYAAFLLSLWDSTSLSDRQITISDLEEETFWGRIHGWNDRQKEAAIDLISETGAIKTDKQMRPWILTRLVPTNRIWPLLYQKHSK